MVQSGMEYLYEYVVKDCIDNDFPTDNENGAPRITKLPVRFERATEEQKASIKDKIVKKLQSKTYCHVSGETLFGELAILQLLKKGGWDGVWVDNYCGILWPEMPLMTTIPLALNNFPNKAKDRFEKIYKNNLIQGVATRNGFFDIFAWKDNGERCIFLEYKGPSDIRDGLGPNQKMWVRNAVNINEDPRNMFLVSHYFDSKQS